MLVMIKMFDSYSKRNFTISAISQCVLLKSVKLFWRLVKTKKPKKKQKKSLFSLVILAYFYIH